MNGTMNATDSLITDPMTNRMLAATSIERSPLGHLKQRATVKVSSRLVLLLLCLTLTSCAEQMGQPPGCVGDTVFQDHFMKEFEADGARFAFPTASVQPASLYWMRKGELAGLRWDTFESHWQTIGTMCNFVNNTSTNDCSICNYCSIGSNGVPAGVPCFGALPRVDNVDVFATEGGLSANPVESFGADSFLRGCPNNNTDPNNLQLVFEPRANAFYEIKLPTTGCASKSVANINIRLVKVDNPQTTAYKLNPQTINGTRYWTWSVMGDPKWLENFSQNLRITNISIRRGKCVTDPVSGSCVPSEESPAATASRILFLPDFQGTVSGHPLEGINRCYSDYGDLDFGIYMNLDWCRNTYDSNLQLPTREAPATPTYDHIQPSLKLTWLVEFNTSEGGDIDPFTPCNHANPTNRSTAGCDPPDPNEDLIIVFTIAAR